MLTPCRMRIETTMSDHSADSPPTQAVAHHPDETLAPFQFEPCGDRCVILVFGSVFSLDLNRQAASVGSRLRDLAAQGLLPGVTDVVSAMVTVGVHYAPERVATLHPDVSPYASMCTLITLGLKASQHSDGQNGSFIEIPVCYAPQYAPDLEDIARACLITVDEVIAAHTAQSLDVLMVGFAPGHPYLGMHDSALSLPRKATPRVRVPQGSVGIANRQSVIYPADLPGGWNLIGRTPLQLFSPAAQPPCLLKGGDKVRFVPITHHEFERLSRGNSK
ncbi:5-oxoprolinase subunit PxpB [Pseudomonas syringae]|uniref:5-oxoprolinase subunit PxpB n=1 Tax=Pseudomonas syringae CC1417 TaxID=1357272 RepID=A0AAU8LP02_PSESX